MLVRATTVALLCIYNSFLFSLLAKTSATAGKLALKLRLYFSLSSCLYVVDRGRLQVQMALIAFVGAVLLFTFSRCFKAPHYTSACFPSCNYSIPMGFMWFESLHVSHLHSEEFKASQDK